MLHFAALNVDYPYVISWVSWRCFLRLSQRCQYALRSLFELAKRAGQGPVSIAEIAEAQAIPPKFLELILGQLKQTGWIKSYRGVHGGYVLEVAPQDLSVGQVIRFIEGPLKPVKCIAGQDGDACPLQGKCAFRGLWDRAERAVSAVYEEATFGSLVEAEKAAEKDAPLGYYL